MPKLQDLLPTPAAVSEDWGEDAAANDPWFRQHAGSLAVAVKEPPPYGRRAQWTPRNDDDFGDGGAFPEIHMAQFPLAMGRETSRQGAANTLALQTDADGKLRYDAIARVGQPKDKVVYSKMSELKVKPIDESDATFVRPDDDAVEQATEKTRAAIEKLTQTKVAAALPVRHADKAADAQYIRYTPSQQGARFNAGAEQRIIRMVEQVQDPMEPPKFKINQKIPRPPPSPPAPVMHSPTRKVTAKEQLEWKIPPCISNWKNSKGYTIPLDKRLAADGRGLQQVHINENFAKLAEALYIADRKAREAVELRSQLEKRVAQKKKEEQEERMRKLAQKAREERAGIRSAARRDAADDEARERDELRRERQGDRRRDRNLARAAPDKQARLRRDKERDVSEQIALGLPDARVRSDQTDFDQRLFNQTRGLDAGGIDDETYAVYDRPWRAHDSAAQHIYRPSKDLDKDVYGDDLDKIIKTNKFVPDRGFAGADPAGSSSAAAAGAAAGPRPDGPVQFERAPDDDDPFGLGQLLRSAKEGKRKQPAADADAAPSKRRK